MEKQTEIGKTLIVLKVIRKVILKESLKSTKYIFIAKKYFYTVTF